MAAIQAGRLGAKTVLLERNSQLGGTTTTGGVCFPRSVPCLGQTGHFGDRLGIGCQISGNRWPQASGFHQESPVSRSVPADLNGQLYSLLAEEACLDAGVSLAYYQFPEKVVQTSGGWLVEVRGQGVSYQLRCKQIIDCSGNATVVGMLGFERMRGDERQPGTQVVVYKGLDKEVISKNAKQIQQMYDQAVKEGRLQKGIPGAAKRCNPSAVRKGM